MPLSCHQGPYLLDLPNQELVVHLLQEVPEFEDTAFDLVTIA